MVYFSLNLFVAVAWMLMNGTYSSLDFIIGFAVGFCALWLGQPIERITGKKTRYFSKFKALIVLVLFFLKELFASVGKVAWDVITPTNHSDPEIIQVPLDAKTDLEITILANMVSLTPGSLSLDVSEDKQYLIVHAMFAADTEQTIRDIKNNLEKKLLEVTRD